MKELFQSPLEAASEGGGESWCRPSISTNYEPDTLQAGDKQLDTLNIAQWAGAFNALQSDAILHGILQLILCVLCIRCIAYFTWDNIAKLIFKTCI